MLAELAALATACPQLSFNLAVSFKVYGSEADVDPRGEQLGAAIAAAKLLGRPPVPLPVDWAATTAQYCGPHLRIVDPARFGRPGNWDSWEVAADVPEVAVATVTLVQNSAPCKAASR